MEIKKIFSRFNFNSKNLLEAGRWGTGGVSAVCFVRGEHASVRIAGGVAFGLDIFQRTRELISERRLRREKDEVVDQCCEYLKAGESVGSIMADYENGELEGKLRTARVVLDIGQVQIEPSNRGFQLGKERLLNAVRRKGREKGLDLPETN